MTRSNAREIAIHLVYSLLYSDTPADELINGRFDPEYYETLGTVCDVYAQKEDPKQTAYIRRVVSGVQEKRAELDAKIERHAVGWKISRISGIARAILEVALYEIEFEPDIPAGVAINEAIELSKHYVEAETTSFINGVLGSCVKEAEGNVSGD